jgi:hypothetical protein
MLPTWPEVTSIHHDDVISKSIWWWYVRSFWVSRFDSIHVLHTVGPLTFYTSLTYFDSCLMCRVSVKSGMFTQVGLLNDEEIRMVAPSASDITLMVRYMRYSLTSSMVDKDSSLFLDGLDQWLWEDPASSNPTSSSLWHVHC